MLQSTAIIGLFLPLFYSCTGNPFGGDEISGGRRQISGQVILNDGASPEGVFLWLAGYNIGTYTNQNGDFQVLLPPQNKQVGVTGTVEQDTLYFYLANYLLETAYVTIAEGEFLYDRGDIDKNGQVRGPIVMQRFLRISTQVTPPVVQADSSMIIKVETHLQAEIACAEVGVPLIDHIDRHSPYRPLGAILLKNLDTNEVFTVRADSNAVGNYIENVCSTPVKLDLQFEFTQALLPAGQYQVVPYLFVNPEDVPGRLLDKLGFSVNSLNRHYFQKPMRRKDGQFVVSN
ncbi:MAG: hypothetical protein ACE5HI_11190 [bacterium]